MKVITDATKDWVTNITCGACNSHLEIDSDDVHFRKRRHASTWSSNEDWFMDFYYAVCAICNNQIKLAETYECQAINEKDLPRIIANKAFGKK